MRGGTIPRGLLVVGAIAAVCLLSNRPTAHLGDEWQPAGLGAGDLSRPWDLLDVTRLVFAGGVAEAQDRGGTGVEGSSDGAGQLAPRFLRITIEPGKAGRFTGSGAPGTSVSVRINGKSAGTAEVGADGNWAMKVAPLGAGDHRVALSRADAPHGGASAEVQEIRIAIPDRVRATEIVAFEDLERGVRNSTRDATRQLDRSSDAQVRDQAERLAREASREFDEFSRRQNEDGERKRIAQQDTAGSGKENGNGGTESSDAGPMARVADWLSNSSRDYFDFVVPELARKGPRGAQMIAKNVPPPERPHDAPAGQESTRLLPDLKTLVESAQEWLRDAHRTYNDVVVKDLSRASQQTLAREERKDAVEVAGSDAGPVLQEADEAEDQARRQGELRQDLDRQAMDVARRAAADQQERERRNAEIRRAEAEETARREAAERKRRIDELLAVREAQRRQAEESERIERARQEEQRQAAERALAEEEQRARAERRAEELRRLEEARQQEEARKQEELLAKLDADRRRAQDERQRAQAERQAERDRQVRVEAERVAQEAAERKRLAAEALGRQESERPRLAARQEKEARDRVEGRIGAVSERARRVGELADEAGFGRRRMIDAKDKSPASDTSASNTSASNRSASNRSASKGSTSNGAVGSKEISRDDRRQVGVARPAPESQEQRRRELRLKQQSERADTVARLAGDAGFGKRRAPTGVAVPLPADPAERREALRTASRLGGPERPYRLSLKDHPRPRATIDRPRRLAGWQARTAPIGGTGCKDRRAGRTIRLPGTYVVARGDTLWHISQRHYRRGLLYRRIYKANRRQIRDPHWIYPCQRFWLPRR